MAADLCYCLYDGGFAVMQNPKVAGLPLKFQRKAWKARQCVAGSKILQAHPDKDARNCRGKAKAAVEIPGEAASNKQRQPQEMVM